MKKKSSRAIALFLAAALSGCAQGNSAQTGTEGSIAASTTAAAAETTTALEAALSEATAAYPPSIEEILSKPEPIYGETQEELVTGILDAFGAHDKEMFERYAYYTRKYSDIYEKFCRKLPKDVDYNAKRTHKDFDIYDFGKSNWHTYAAFLKEDTDTELTIDTDFNYEKEMYYIANINVRTIKLERATGHSLGLMKFDEEETETAPGEGKTPLKVSGRDYFNAETMHYFAEDALESGGEFYYEFDYAYGFLAPGVYDDSFRSPEKFDLENFLYTPDKEYDEPRGFLRLSAGEFAGGAKIKSAFSSLTKENDDGESYAWIMEALLDGEYELTGVCVYYYIEEYGASSGDMFFIPDESIAGFPLVCGFKPGASFGGGVGAYSEIPRGLYIGNLFNAGNRSDNITLGEGALEDLNKIFGSETGNSAKRVKLKLSDIKLSWNDQIGTSLSSAVPLRAWERR